MILQQTRKLICLEKKHDENLTSFATSQFSTLMMISGHLEGLVSHKSTQYQMYVYIDTSMYRKDVKANCR